MIMESSPVINVVASQCQPEVEEKFNKWYDEIHIPLLFKFKGMKKVTRYKIVKETEEYPAYLTLYEFESRKAYEEYAGSPELAAARAEMNETWKEGGFEIKWRVQYEALKIWER
jgi:heme-degrading monooxygenase HmoA